MSYFRTSVSGFGYRIPALLLAAAMLPTCVGCGSDDSFGGPPGLDMPPGFGDPITAPGDEGESATQLRSDFRETVYVNPSLITDDNGQASVSVPLADSITTWRVSADASSQDGRIGSATHHVRTFQPFFVDLTMPSDLTTGDELEIPAVVYNYLESPQQVTVSLTEAGWFESLGPLYESIELNPSEVRAVKFRIKVLAAGEQQIELHGEGGDIADGLVRSVHVTPDGQPVDESSSGRLSGTVDHTITVPPQAIPGGTEVTLALTPGFAAEAVQGIDSLFREPTGCFEQTTASAWPNTLVASYLEASGQQTAEGREKAMGLVTRGYQRLLTFESPTGGYNWWGNDDPGNRILTAIMVWHLKDLETLIAIDENVRDRALAWLLGQQNADGTWDPGDALHAGNESLGTDRTRSTSFIAWALGHTGWADESVGRANDWLASQRVPHDDVYAVALASNALALTRPTARETQDWIGALVDLRTDHEDGSTSWTTGAPSWTGARGNTAAIETTGLAAYALYNASAHLASWDQAMEYLMNQKDSVGTWYNTQATMNALRALGAAAQRQEAAIGQLDVFVDGTLAQEVLLSEANADDLQSYDLTPLIVDGSRVELSFVGTGTIAYRLTRRVYMPPQPGQGMPLDLQVRYDRTQVTVGDAVQTTVTAINNDRSIRNQVMVRIGRAPGFLPNQQDLQMLVNQGVVSRFETRSRDVTFYLMELEPGENREFTFGLTPNLVVSATAEASAIYPYYEPELQRRTDATHFEVVSR